MNALAHETLSGLAPGYQQIHFEPAELGNRLRLVASPDGRDGSVRIHQDADLYAARLDAGQAVDLPGRPGRRYWVQVIEGVVQVGATTLRAGDGLGVTGTGTGTGSRAGEVEPGTLRIAAAEAAHLLAFDLVDA